MNVFSWIWLALFVGGFGVLETVAIIKGDKPNEPRTLTANVRALITGRAWWHWPARIILAGVLVWLFPHFRLLG